MEQDLKEILRERNGELRKELKDEEKYGELRNFFRENKGDLVGYKRLKREKKTKEKSRVL